MRHAGNICLVALLTAAAPAGAAEQAVAVDLQVIRQLQETIRQQQAQLQQQAAQLQQQEELLLKLARQVSVLTAQDAAKSPQQVLPTEQPKPAPPSGAPSAPPVVSGGNNIKLTLSGQINRAMNVVADGAGTAVYHVDNNVSNSRIRLVGTVPVDSDLTLGTRLEFAFTADESSKVSQNNQAPGNYLNARWADISLTSKTYGKLSLGKGNTASYTTAAADLSRTDIVHYSSVADIAGGLVFRRKDGSLTATALSDVFTDYDGLNVKSRLRYDTPAFYGFSVAASLVSDRRSDLGLYWAGHGYGFEAAAGFGLADPRLAQSGLQYDGSFALLHTASGLNLTLSSGMLEKKRDRNAFSYYAKLGWLAALSRFGSTAFGVDLSRSENSSAAGDWGTSVGAAVVQEFKKLSSELYLQYRIFALRMGNGTPVHDIGVGTLGVRVKF